MSYDICGYWDNTLKKCKLSACYKSNDIKTCTGWLYDATLDGYNTDDYEDYMDDPDTDDTDSSKYDDFI